jgi:hypothetical protein
MITTVHQFNWLIVDFHLFDISFSLIYLEFLKSITWYCSILFAFFQGTPHYSISINQMIEWCFFIFIILFLPSRIVEIFHWIFLEQESYHFNQQLINVIFSQSLAKYQWFQLQVSWNFSFLQDLIFTSLIVFSS